MRRRPLAVASFLVGVSALLGAALAEEPGLPEETKPFRQTQRARLAAAWGGYEWKHATDVRTLAFSADGRALLAADARSLVVRERAGGREQKAFSLAGRAVFSPDGKKVLVAGDELAVHDLATTRKLWSHPVVGARACFAHDGKRIAYSSGATLTVLDAEKGTQVRALRLDAEPEHFALSPDGKRALAGDSRRLVLHDLASQRKLGVIESEAGTTALAWAELLVTGTRDGRLRAWDADGPAKPVWEKAHERAIVALSVAGRSVTALSEDGALVVRDASGGERRRFEDRGATAIALAPDGLAVASARSTIKLWSLETGARIGAGPGPDGGGHEGPVLGLAVSPDHLHVISAGADHAARVWNTGSPRVLRVLDLKEGAVTAAAFSADGKEALTASDDGTFELWDMKEGADLHRFEAGGLVAAVQFGGDVLRSVTAEGQLVFFERTKRARSFEGGAKGPRVPVALAGKLALLGGAKGVKVWDVEAGREVRTLDAREPRVLCASSSGKRALVATAKDLKVFDLQSGFELRGLDLGGLAAVSALAISADDQLALSATEDGAVVLWDLDAGKEIDRIDLGRARDFARSVAFTREGFLVGTARGVVLRFEWLGA